MSAFRPFTSDVPPKCESENSLLPPVLTSCQEAHTAAALASCLRRFRMANPVAVNPTPVQAAAVHSRPIKRQVGSGQALAVGWLCRAPECAAIQNDRHAPE